ncbi:MAG: hypothetical protein MSR67_05965 [Oscillospiraceae bacterium]|nr:hypothetical protein [Oscillospiraceae bacterium]
MGIECVVIAGMFVLFIAVFLCTKRRQWAWATLPLLLVPLTDITLEFLLTKAFNVDVTAFGAILALVIAVAVSAAWIGFLAGHLDHKRYKASYIGITNLFNVALAAIIISNILSTAALDANIPVNG